MQTTSESTAERTTASHLLCASLVTAKLWPGEGIYRKMVEWLAHPNTLPYDTAQDGCEVPQRPLRKTDKALQISIQRIRDDIKAGKTAFHDELDVLDSVYGMYCWLSLRKAGYSDSEKQMLLSLVALDRNVPQVEGLVLTRK